MIRRLLLLNGVAITGVILFHAAGWSFTALIFWADRYGATPADQVGSLFYYFLRFIEQIVVFCISAFLFVSGFFMAFATGRAQQTIGWKLISIRIRDLIIPYTVWTLVFWLFFIFEAQFLDGRTFSLREYLTMFLTGSTDPAYYYVPLLIQFYLLSPFLVRWAKTHPVSMLVVTGIIQLTVQLQYFPSLLGLDVPYLNVVPKWLFVARIFWFSLGVVVGFNVKPVQEWAVRYKKGLALAALALIPIGMVEWEVIQSFSGQMWLQQRETFIDSLYSLAVIFAFLGYYQTKLRYAHTLDDWGSKSFGIYLIHTMVMTYMARLIVVMAPSLLRFEWFFFLFLVVVGMGTPLAMMAVVNRSPLRPYYKYIFG